MGGKASRDKGNRVEREIVKWLSDAGIPSKRQVGSGAHSRFDPRLENDIRVGLRPDPHAKSLFIAEAKGRKPSQVRWRTIEKWLGDNDLLFLREDRKAPLVVCSGEVALRLLQTYYRTQMELEDV